MPAAPRVMISYSHDSPEHADRVLALADRLRADGADAVIDQYEPHPAEGWPLWMERQIEKAEFVLLICTETYLRRVKREEAPGVGRGVCWEGNLIYNELYNAQTVSGKFVPVLFAASDAAYIPAPLQGHTHYRVDDETSYEALYRRLTYQPKVEKPELGPIQALPKRQRAPECDTPQWQGLFMVPHARNPLFTGREAVLTAIGEALQQSRSAGITQAITGLGGVGKSQTALEYAYRHRDDYPFVFWVGAESEETLNRDYGEIARRLDLAVKEAKEAEVVREGVEGWLAEHGDYLLILDNADDPKVAAPYLPPAPQGHVLVTSRARSLTGLRVVRPVVLEAMPEDEAVAFLLTRTGRGERPEAAALATELGYLPLALEQAGAYIGVQEISFGEYLALYRRLRLGLLERTKPEWGDTERTVQTTWEASFAAVRTANPAAADLLAVSAFFAPEQIPYELLILGAPELGEPLATALADAADDRSTLWELLTFPASYSLIQRDPEAESYSLHRLVQEVIRAPKPQAADSAGLADEERHLWAERAVRVVNRAFPAVKLETWPLCERLLPHALAAAGWIEAERLESPEAGRLLNQIGYYVQERARYEAAETQFQRALAVRRQALGDEHPDTAQSLMNLGDLYRVRGRYTEAEPLLQRALAILQSALGTDDMATGIATGNLAKLYHAQGCSAEADLLYQQALHTIERAVGPHHPHTATSLGNLADLYRELGRYAEAEPLFELALAIVERGYGPEHPDTATALSNLANVYQSRGRYADAKELYQRALGIQEQTVGPDHPDTATTLNNLAGLCWTCCRHDEADRLFSRALAIREEALGPGHPLTASSCNNLGNVYYSLGRYTEAEALVQRALAVLGQTLGETHPQRAKSLNNLAAIYRSQGKPAEAEALLKRALAIDETAYGPEHAEVATDLNNLAMLYHAHGRPAEAEALLKRALAILEQAWGPDHPSSVTCRENLASLRAEIEAQ